MPNVYLPAIPMRYDAILDERAPALDISPAANFGFLIILLDLDRPLTPFEMPPAIDEMRTRLAGVRADDFIVCVGDPVLIAAATAIALNKNGSVNMLRWNRLNKTYQAIEVTL